MGDAPPHDPSRDGYTTGDRRQGCGRCRSRGDPGGRRSATRATSTPMPSTSFQALADLTKGQMFRAEDSGKVVGRPRGQHRGDHARLRRAPTRGGCSPARPAAPAGCGAARAVARAAADLRWWRAVPVAGQAWDATVAPGQAGPVSAAGLVRRSRLRRPRSPARRGRSCRPVSVPAPPRRCPLCRAASCTVAGDPAGGPPLPARTEPAAGSGARQHDRARAIRRWRATTPRSTSTGRPMPLPTSAARRGTWVNGTRIAPADVAAPAATWS